MEHLQAELKEIEVRRHLLTTQLIQQQKQDSGGKRHKFSTERNLEQKRTHADGSGHQTGRSRQNYRPQSSRRERSRSRSRHHDRRERSPTQQKRGKRPQFAETIKEGPPLKRSIPKKEIRQPLKSVIKPVETTHSISPGSSSLEEQIKNEVKKPSLIGSNRKRPIIIKHTVDPNSTPPQDPRQKKDKTEAVELELLSWGKNREEQRPIIEPEGIDQEEETKTALISVFGSVSSDSSGEEEEGEVPHTPTRPNFNNEELPHIPELAPEEIPQTQVDHSTDDAQNIDFLRTAINPLPELTECSTVSYETALPSFEEICFPLQPLLMEQHDQQLSYQGSSKDPNFSNNETEHLIFPQTQDLTSKRKQKRQTKIKKDGDVTSIKQFYTSKFLAFEELSKVRYEKLNEELMNIQRQINNILTKLLNTRLLKYDDFITE